MKAKNDISRSLFYDWWNYDQAADNFGNAFEQSTLVTMMKNRHAILSHLAYMHGETEFVPCDNQVWNITISSSSSSS